MGIESIMVNSNPETVSTDYDTSDKLYFEPLTREDVLSIVEQEKPEGIIVQFGGQTPLNLSVLLQKQESGSWARARTALTWLRTGDGSRNFLSALACASRKRIATNESEAIEAAARIGILFWFGPLLCSEAGPWKSFTSRETWSTI